MHVPILLHYELPTNKRCFFGHVRFLFLYLKSSMFIQSIQSDENTSPHNSCDNTVTDDVHILKTSNVTALFDLIICLFLFHFTSSCNCTLKKI